MNYRYFLFACLLTYSCVFQTWAQSINSSSCKTYLIGSYSDEAGLWELPTGTSVVLKSRQEITSDMKKSGQAGPELRLSLPESRIVLWVQERVIQTLNHETRKIEDALNIPVEFGNVTSVELYLTDGHWEMTVHTTKKRSFSVEIDEKARLLARGLSRLVRPAIGSVTN